MKNGHSLNMPTWDAGCGRGGHFVGRIDTACSQETYAWIVRMTDDATLHWSRGPLPPVGMHYFYRFVILNLCYIAYFLIIEFSLIPLGIFHPWVIAIKEKNTSALKRIIVFVRPSRSKSLIGTVRTAASTMRANLQQHPCCYILYSCSMVLLGKVRQFIMHNMQILHNLGTKGYYRLKKKIMITFLLPLLIFFSIEKVIQM